ncbi:Modulating plastid sigma factor [Spatholobus suberectus]|nr:Modulating plastid sigma factor [Spatholobus suberectus]
MGKLKYDPNCYPHKESNTTLKIGHKKTPKKTVKITYISSPVLVRACDASEFRSVVQQLTGKDSNNKVQSSHKGYSALMHQDMQSGDQSATEDGNGSCHYNRSMTSSLEFDEDYFWKELALSVLPSPCVLV